jgi:hypothetical protein
MDSELEDASDEEEEDQSVGGVDRDGKGAPGVGGGDRQSVRPGNSQRSESVVAPGAQRPRGHWPVTEHDFKSLSLERWADWLSESETHTLQCDQMRKSGGDFVSGSIALHFRKGAAAELKGAAVHSLCTVIPRGYRGNTDAW